MANHKSAIKRHRQNQKRQTYARWWKSRVRMASKQVLDAADAGKSEEAQTLLISAISQIDKASGKGIYHKKTASRKISRLTKHVSAAASA